MVNVYKMKSQNINLNQLQSGIPATRETSNKVNIGAVFSERTGCYLNEFSLFLAHFNDIPNFIHEINIAAAPAVNGLLTVANYKKRGLFLA